MKFAIISLLAISVLCRWSPERAKKWYNEHAWLSGCNFIPSTAVNELEMWQPETFDLPTIDRELGWAEDLGFNTMRVFLHHLLWVSDKEGFFNRMDKYLEISDSHHISTMFVLLDDVWAPHSKLGKQPEPIPHTHNSRWLKSPDIDISSDLERQKTLEGYIKETIKRFANDKRVLMWDLYNEPGGGIPANLSVPLINRTFAWAREVNPSQPIIIATWYGDWSNPSKLKELDRVTLAQTDLVVFHNYEKLDGFIRAYKSLIQYGRPIICNEYMARTVNSTIKYITPYMKANKIGGYTWGLVSGKTQTIYPWDSWSKKYKEEPKLWHHDILRQDGTPFDPEEVKLLRKLRFGDEISNS